MSESEAAVVEKEKALSPEKEAAGLVKQLWDLNEESWRLGCALRKIIAEADDPVTKGRYRRVVRMLFPGTKTWKAVVDKLNSRDGRYGRLHSLYLRLDLPMHHWITTDWDHLHSRQAYSTTAMAKAMDEK
jgi:hypothetical protein